MIDCFDDWTPPKWDGVTTAKAQRAALGRPDLSLPHFTNGKFDAPITGDADRESVAVSPTATWIPQWRVVEVFGVSIAAGLFYLSDKSADNSGKSLDAEPSAVDANLDATPGPLGVVRASSYVSLTASQRHAYLLWLALGRPTPTERAFMELAVAGFERRLLVDGDCDAAERLLIARELERFSKAGWSAARALRDLVLANLPDEVLLAVDPTFDDLSWDLTGAGVLASSRTRTPLTAMWAVAAALCNLNPAAASLAAAFEYIELRELFATRYRAKFGAGIVAAEDAERAEVWYRPINRSLSSGTSARFLRVETIAASIPVGEILALAEECVSDLRSYLRVTTTGGSSTALEDRKRFALALLPYEVVTTLAKAEVRGLVDHLREVWSRDGGLLNTAELFDTLWPCPPNLSTWGVVRGLRRVLADHGWGLEPDPALGRWLQMPLRFSFFPQVEPVISEFDWRRAVVVTIGCICNLVGQGEVFFDALTRVLALDPERDARLIALCRTYPGTTLEMPRAFLKEARVGAVIHEVLVEVTANVKGSAAATLKTALARFGIALGPDPQRAPLPPSGFALRQDVLDDLAGQDRVIHRHLAGLSDHLEPGTPPAVAFEGGENRLSLDLMSKLPIEGSISGADFAALCAAIGQTPSVAIELINTFAVADCGEPLLEPGDPILIDRDVQNFIRKGTKK
jgi:hypothetical protein